MLQPASCRLEMRTRVRLLDISLSGTLVAAETTLPRETEGHLRTTVEAAPFASHVKVRRVVGGSGRHSSMGTTFTAMDEHSRKRLEAFLHRASRG
jgi:hypothetical protein